MMSVLGVKNVPLTRQEIQRKTVDVLRLIDQICRQEGLRYWLMYGSLIGAVRHHGFIPWDDDLDIAMPREDFEKLKQYFMLNEADLLPFVFLDYSTRAKGLPFLIARISDMKYKEVGEYGYAVSDLGIFIDIYPFDGMGNSEEEARKLKVKCEKYVNRYMSTYYFSLGRPAKDFLRVIKKRINQVAYGTPEENLAALKDEIKKLDFNSSLYVGNCTWNVGWPNDFYLKEDFEDLLIVEFESLKVPIPSGFDRVLRKCYGDYMKLPPSSERKGHHYYEIYPNAGVES